MLILVHHDAINFHPFSIEVVLICNAHVTTSYISHLDSLMRIPEFIVGQVMALFVYSFFITDNLNDSITTSILQSYVHGVVSRPPPSNLRSRRLLPCSDDSHRRQHTLQHNPASIQVRQSARKNAIFKPEHNAHRGVDSKINIAVAARPAPLWGNKSPYPTPDTVTT